MLRRSIVLFCLALAVPAAAAGPRSELAARADRIVVATCESTSSAWEDGRIWSRAVVRTRRAVRGPGGEIVVRQPGGVVGDLGQRVSHVQLLRPGESYL